MFTALGGGIIPGGGGLITGIPSGIVCITPTGPRPTGIGGLIGGPLA